MFVGALSTTGSIPTKLTDWYSFMLSGLPFALALMTILVCHEFGHYLAGKHHHTMVTLPFFIPFPLSLFGTMGAFIQLKEPPKNRRILLDIGIAGPLAGLIVAIPILLYGLSLSPVERLPFKLPLGQLFEGNSILYLLLKYIVKGQLLPEPFNYAFLDPILYWIRYFFTGLPLPAGGLDVTLHPIAWAGWAGLFVTALNLIPAGQLDGGHIMYVLIGKRTSSLLPFILGALVLLGFAWSGWWFWAALIFFLGRFHAEPLDQITSLDTKRKILAIVGVGAFILVFMPVPLA
jgi:membrane-associated protease RseP (regulator of RpoE activity)